MKKPSRKVLLKGKIIPLLALKSQTLLGFDYHILEQKTKTSCLVLKHSEVVVLPS